MQLVDATSVIACENRDEVTPNGELKDRGSNPRHHRYRMGYYSNGRESAFKKRTVSVQIRHSPLNQIMGYSMNTCFAIRCGPSIKAIGLCDKHYLYPHKRGRDLGLTRHQIKLNFIDDCVNSNTDDCLEPEKKCKGEYPLVNLGNGDVRIGWVVLERTIGKRPDGLVMRHLCGNSRCCNPKHLKWDTQLNNASDRKIHGTEPPKRGESNPNRKLSLEDVEYIRRVHYSLSKPYKRSNTKTLAERFGVSQNQIMNIVKGKSW